MQPPAAQCIKGPYGSVPSVLILEGENLLLHHRLPATLFLAVMYMQNYR